MRVCDGGLGLDGQEGQGRGGIGRPGSQGTDAATALIHSAKKNFERWQVAAGMINATIPFVQVFTNQCAT